MADQPMKFGVATPVTSMHPRRQVTWERDAGPDDLKRIAIAADDLGYYWLTCAEHVGIPTEVAKIRGARYYDALSTLSYFAAVTNQIKLFTTVIVLGYHHPLGGGQALRDARQALQRAAGPGCRRRLAPGGVRPARR